MKSTARGSECKHIGTSSAELQSLHNAFSTRRGWNESPHYWQALNLYGYKKQWETKTRLIWLKALHFSRLCLWLSFLPAPPISPPSGSQQEYTLNHFVLYLEKLSDRSFCGQHKSISSCYRAKNILFLSCWLCTFWTVMALVDRHHGRITPGDK